MTLYIDYLHVKYFDMDLNYVIYYKKGFSFSSDNYKSTWLTC